MNPGVYTAEIVAAGLTTSQGGTPAVWITVAVDDGFGQPEEMTGKIWLSEKSLNMARGQFRAIGFDYRQHELSFESIQAVVGHEVDVTLEERTYKGNTKIEITRFGKANEPPTPEALADAMKKLRALKPSPDEVAEEDAERVAAMKKVVNTPGPMELRGTPAPASSDPISGYEPPPTAEDDSEIPF